MTPVKAVPLRVARAIMVTDKSGHQTPKQVGNWMPYTENSIHMALQTSLAYDDYELGDPTGVSPIPGDNPTYTGCTSGGSRWANGDGYHPGIRFNDLPLVPGAGGALSSRACVGFRFDVDVLPGANHAFKYFLFTTENFPVTAPTATTGANDPTAAGRGDYPGWVFDYGHLPKNLPLQYYYSDLDLTSVSGTWQLPMDGSGGILQEMGDVDSTANTIAFTGSVTYWGDVPGNPTPTENINMWDDDDPTNLIFTDGSGGSVNELYDYTLNQCPVVLGMMVCFFYAPPLAEVLAPTSEAINLGNGTIGNLGSWAADDANARRICKFVVPTLSSPFIRVTLNYTTTKPTPTAIDFIVKAKMVHGGAFKIRLFIQNKVSSAYVQVLPDTTINLAYATYTGSATGTLTNFVGGGGAMTGRLEIQQTGPAAVTLPCADFEFANMKVTG